MNERRTFTTGDGCSIAWRFDGPEDAPVLLLSNSLGTDLDMWDPQLPQLTSRYRILRYDSRGHGASASPPGSYSMDRLGRDVVELLDMLGLERVDFCGLSKGGMVGQWLGVRAPERLRRLVLANTSPFMGSPAAWQQRIDQIGQDGLEWLLEASLTRWFTPDFRANSPDQVAWMRAMLIANDPGGYAGCCAAIRDMDMRPLLPLIHRPTLVIGGREDPATPPPHSEALASGIAGARLVWLDAAHLSNVECASDFTRHVLTFQDR